jgi:hypothetical protein
VSSASRLVTTSGNNTAPTTKLKALAAHDTTTAHCPPIIIATPKPKILSTIPFHLQQNAT